MLPETFTKGIRGNKNYNKMDDEEGGIFLFSGASEPVRITEDQYMKASKVSETTESISNNNGVVRIEVESSDSEAEDEDRKRMAEIVSKSYESIIADRDRLVKVSELCFLPCVFLFL